MGSVEQWACGELAKLGASDPEVIVRYLQPLEEGEEVREYLEAMLEKSNPTHAAFIDEFVLRQQQAKEGKDARFYRKPDLEEDAVKVAERKKSKAAKDCNGRGKDGKDCNGKGRDKEMPVNAPPSGAVSGKKKTKFVNLYSEEGQNKEVVLLSGRHKCECQASRHRLIGNCLGCGRVVCRQEGSGPCGYCGRLVVSREERELLNKGNKKSEALQRRLFSEKNAVIAEREDSDKSPEEDKKQSEALRKALEQKERLLEYDRNSERRTRVLDDESDYFSLGSRWLSHEDKEKLRKREEELREKRFSRGGQTITLDLGRRCVVEDVQSANVYNPDDPLVKEILETRTPELFQARDEDADKTLLDVTRPMYQSSEHNGNMSTQSTYPKTNANMTGCNTNVLTNTFSLGLRIQDREQQEMRDEGRCLSMHQPWASLLVMGIKKHEGRSWYSSHRGRLWIAAAAKLPQPEEIHQVQEMYRVMLGEENVRFPTYYPSGCLLGCVDVLDVLAQEEYREKYPEGESESPYVFVCENPQEMVLKFPMKGQHKIFKLESKIHQTAKKALRSN